MHLQMGLQLSASHVGTLMLPAGLMLAVTIAGVGRVADKVAPHILVSAGLVLLALSFAVMVTVHLQTPLWLLVCWAVVGRVGLGLILPSLNTGAMHGLSMSLIPQGASVINFVRMLGGAAGVSLCGILLEWRLAAHGDSLSNPMSSVNRLAAFNDVFWVLAGLCALATWAAWKLRPHQED
jgi:predicted MFS family arabinose efflux permease